MQRPKQIYVNLYTRPLVLPKCNVVPAQRWTNSGFLKLPIQFMSLFLNRWEYSHYMWMGLFLNEGTLLQTAPDKTTGVSLRTTCYETLMWWRMNKLLRDLLWGKKNLCVLCFYFHSYDWQKDVSLWVGWSRSGCHFSMGICPAPSFTFFNWVCSGSI